LWTYLNVQDTFTVVNLFILFIGCYKLLCLYGAFHCFVWDQFYSLHSQWTRARWHHSALWINYESIMNQLWINYESIYDIMINNSLFRAFVKSKFIRRVIYDILFYIIIPESIHVMKQLHLLFVTENVVAILQTVIVQKDFVLMDDVGLGLWQAVVPMVAAHNLMVSK